MPAIDSQTYLKRKPGNTNLGCKAQYDWEHANLW
jgi:hypothetical protein